jgi:hypothetical protein
MPQWDVSLNIPLYRGNFRLVDLLDTALFHVQPDSTVAFAVDVPIDPVTPGEALDVFAVNNSVRIGLADFVISGLGSGQVRADLGDIVKVPIPDSGAKGVLEPFETTFERECPLSGVAEADIAEGLVRVTATNYTALAFDSLVVSSALGICRLGALPAHDFSAARMDVGGAAVSSPMLLTCTVGSPGTGDTVLLSKHDSVVVRFEFDSLRVGNARIRIPEARGQKRCQVGIASSKPFRIDSLALNSGTCCLQVANEFDVPADVRVDVPKLGISSSYRLEGHGTVSLDLDLAGLRLDNRSRVNSLFDFHVTAEPARTEDFVQLSKSDGVGVSYQTTKLGTQVVAGEFRQPVYVGSAKSKLPQLVPYGIRGLRVTAAELALDLDNSIGFPLDICLKLTALRGGASAAVVETTVTVAAGQLGMPRLSEFILPMTELINTGPDSICLEYTARILGSGSCEQGASVSGRAMVSTPLRMAFVPDTVPTPVRQVRISDDQHQLIAKHLVGAGATLSIANHLPVGLGGRLVISRDSTATGTTLTDSVVIPFGVRGGKCDRRGNCVGDADTTMAFELDSAEVSLFYAWPLDAKVLFELPQTDTVNVLTTDRMAFDALLNLRVRVKE